MGDFNKGKRAGLGWRRSSSARARTPDTCRHQGKHPPLPCEHHPLLRTVLGAHTLPPAPGREDSNEFYCSLSRKQGQASDRTADPPTSDRTADPPRKGSWRQGRESALRVGPTTALASGLRAGIWFPPTTSPRLPWSGPVTAQRSNPATTGKVGRCSRLDCRQTRLSHRSRMHATQVRAPPPQQLLVGNRHGALRTSPSRGHCS